MMDKQEMANEFMLRANRLRASSGTEAFIKEADMNAAASRALHKQADAEEKAKNHDDDHFDGKCPTCGQPCACPPKPKRPSLKGLEKHIRTSCADWKFVERDGAYLNHAADILRALDEKVVPWIRRHVCFGAGIDGDARDMLRALGEEVP